MDALPTPVAESRATPSSKPIRVVRGVAWTGLVLGGLFVVALGVAPTFFGGGYFAAAAIVTVVVIFPFVNRRLLSNPWQRIGVGYAALAGILIYLAADDSAIRRRPTLEEFAPARPGDEKSYAVLLHYGSDHPLGRDFSFQPPDRILHGEGAWKPSDPGWKEWVLSNRSDIETGWKELEPVRDWWAELNTFDRIADLTTNAATFENVAFTPMRAVTRYACAIASLQAIDDHGDAAIDTLIPVFAVGRKLGASSRTMVRSMIAIYIQKTSLETADFILNNAEVSLAARNRLALALGDSKGDEVYARRLMDMEYAWAVNVVTHQGLREMLTTDFPRFKNAPAWCFEAVSPFLCNRRRTINTYSDLMGDLAQLAAQRKIEQFKQRSGDYVQGAGQPGFKNFGGSYLLFNQPAYFKIIDVFWKTSDLRVAMRTRLKG